MAYASSRACPKQLIAEVADLKSGMSAIEERARSELGMIGRNETFYQVVPVRPRTTLPTRPAARTQTAAR
jgi:cell division protein FtsB